MFGEKKKDGKASKHAKEIRGNLETEEQLENALNNARNEIN